ncbi:cytochrome c peroxidase [Kiloniella sp.]|uniref:cytochrome c peroxidase n=1 Tax=Kiloniella sp. TaxID=1938587 RepID=UPI003B0146AF
MKRILTALALALVPSLSFATVVEQAPWAPKAAAYRLTLFMGNLNPVPWQKIEDSWEKPVDGASADVPALSLLSAAERTSLEGAFTGEDRQALFEAATKTIHQGIIEHLAAADKNMGTPKAALDVARAQALYRAFEDGIKAADPKSYRALGRAWLEINSALGSKGVLGTGALKADAGSFNSARETIETYLNTNYAPDDFSDRAKLSSIPESAILRGDEIDLPATLPPGSNIADQEQLPRLILQFEEAGEDEANLPLVAYGDMLFDSPVIFGKPASELGIACSTCHNRSDVNRDFFIPGLSHRAGGMDVDSAFFNPLFNDRSDDALDTPSLRGIRFTAPYGRDGREPSLRRFTRNVIVTEFAGEEPTPFQLDALVAYMRQFDFLPNPKIDRSGRLTDGASASALRGEALFNSPFDGLNGRACSSCHTPDRNFRDGKTYDIVSSEPPFENGTATPFETPTLRNINFTAPYMHDGSLPTLASVVDWFNDTKSLGLDVNQRADLTAYLEAVGDGEEPYQVFQGKESTFRLAFEELTTFASTLNTLLPARDTKNIAILVDTVAPDLAADAGTMSNLSARPQVYQLASTLRAVGDAVAAGEWQVAETKWQEFKSLQDQYDARMF